ncbi:hypothetical protein BVC80_8715g5 [Macleaya cordata]|uniref:Endonuclease/exonuclease/phosphatase n=1 Tax=Macleaya cordata TaxID=56857 RepID=A0A200QAE1_MACCD|nr:hypothetical protein BVC80_8715g5 [Macleaya cordata]
MVHDRCLIDLGYAGLAYTWANRSDNSEAIVRLDRALCTPSGWVSFQDADVLHLPRLKSDHAPIILNTARVIPRRKRNFKFKSF